MTSTAFFAILSVVCVVYILFSALRKDAHAALHAEPKDTPTRLDNTIVSLTMQTVPTGWTYTKYMGYHAQEMGAHRDTKLYSRLVAEIIGSKDAEKHILFSLLISEETKEEVQLAAENMLDDLGYEKLAGNNWRRKRPKTY